MTMDFFGELKRRYLFMDVMDVKDVKSMLGDMIGNIDDEWWMMRLFIAAFMLGHGYSLSMYEKEWVGHPGKQRKMWTANHELAQMCDALGKLDEAFRHIWDAAERLRSDHLRNGNSWLLEHVDKNINKLQGLERDLSRVLDMPMPTYRNLRQAVMFWHQTVVRRACPGRPGLLDHPLVKRLAAEEMARQTYCLGVDSTARDAIVA